MANEAKTGSVRLVKHIARGILLQPAVGHSRACGFSRNSSRLKGVRHKWWRRKKGGSRTEDISIGQSRAEIGVGGDLDVVEPFTLAPEEMTMVMELEETAVMLEKARDGRSR